MDGDTGRPGVWTAAGAFVRGVMFPGDFADPDRTPRFTSLLLVLLLPALLLYPRLGFRLLEPDESRYAQIPREMLERGDWVVPTLEGEPYLDKPPLMYWLVMASYSAFGVADWAARLVPAAAVHLTVLLVYLFGTRALGERPALWGAVLLAAVPGLMTVGRVLILDGLLTLWLTLALGAAFEALRGPAFGRRWWLVACVGVALGVLTKGPVAMLLAVGPVLAWRVLRPAAPQAGWRALLAALGVVVAVNLPWYVAIGVREPEFVRYFLWEHNVVRFVQPFDHIKPVWFYGPILLLAFVPVTPWFAGLAAWLAAGGERAGRRTPEFAFFLAAAGWCVLFFSLSGCKLPTYILPAFPPLALALGYYVARGRAAGASWRPPAATAVLGVALLATLHHAVLPWYAAQRSPFGRPELLAEYLADPATPVVCYPRNCDSVAFYAGRADLRNVRSKHTFMLVADLQSRPRTVVLFTHRHSLEALRNTLPPDLRLTRTTSLHRTFGVGLLDKLAGETPWGLCDAAIVEQVGAQ